MGPAKIRPCGQPAFLIVVGLVVIVACTALAAFRNSTLRLYPPNKASQDLICGGMYFFDVDRSSCCWIGASGNLYVSSSHLRTLDFLVYPGSCALYRPLQFHQGVSILVRTPWVYYNEYWTCDQVESYIWYFTWYSSGQFSPDIDRDGKYEKKYDLFVVDYKYACPLSFDYDLFVKRESDR